MGGGGGSIIVGLEGGAAVVGMGMGMGMGWF